MRRNTERLMYGDMLDRDGFCTLRLSSASQAREAIGRDQPSVLMVGLDDLHDEALDLVRWAKAQRQDIKVIGITTSPLAARSATQAGCDDCLEVPVPIGEVVSTVHRWVA
jgi:DNA-binding NtrC family response regulator